MTTSALTVATADPSGRLGTRRLPLGRALREPGLVLAVAYLGLVLLAALAPNVLTTWDPVTDVDPAASLSAPSAEHWFGTDALGRDVYSRVVHGANLSITAGLLAVSISLVVGVLAGVVSGYVGRWADSTIMRVMDVMIAIPGLLLSLAFVSILGFGVVNVAIAVGIAGIPGFARLARAETLRLRNLAYVDAARCSGSGSARIIVRHIVPGAGTAVVVLAALEIGGAVLAVSALSFLGFGAVPPTPEWGSMVNEGRSHIASAWWLTTFPGAAIAATVLACNRISRAVRVAGRS
ncbi:binding-protein-dependent transport systems inner membrane component [Beutenbergia cavernae DSM 12333]|uniref:Binding-protein-dependent transport systems inner membrane component n=1 Tax=Beutenbergia cavernae (strain ATCC BAA-8 / DSM 12333 / CCUG 43141 / JCM 11478 / NBRC 16432 / NCIMB 13614 / HKI 0122) TaxID=471853 RepID=C5BX59_BEUC1|nr:ABC transporter permease [Beutenbergia cavernae]ACQ78734.1 binding-protein-dependent transport systems inner membrane component [Beutenbergia cavernae DSM 12333]